MYFLWLFGKALNKTLKTHLQQRHQTYCIWFKLYGVHIKNWKSMAKFTETYTCFWKTEIYPMIQNAELQKHQRHMCWNVKKISWQIFLLEMFTWLTWSILYILQSFRMGLVQYAFSIYVLKYLILFYHDYYIYKSF